MTGWLRRMLHAHRDPDWHVHGANACYECWFGAAPVGGVSLW